MMQLPGSLNRVTLLVLLGALGCSGDTTQLPTQAATASPSASQAQATPTASPATPSTQSTPTAPPTGTAAPTASPTATQDLSTPEPARTPYPTATPAPTPTAAPPTQTPSAAPATPTAAPTQTPTLAPATPTGVGTPTEPATAPPTPTPPPPDAPVVQTADGPVGGFVGTGSLTGAQAYVYLGVPFAAPPVGPLRWRAPVAPEPWTEPLTGRSFGPLCPQYITSIVIEEPGGSEDAVVAGSEDCLYLNVFRPAAEGAARPVMVWIHGGGNEVGSASDDLFDGANITTRGDVVLVSVEYRLGPLGYLNHPALITGEDAISDGGSFGTLDLQLALEWVQTNAAAFGGDPNNVTIFGESAGGVNVWALLLSNLGAQRFQRGISESAGPSIISVDKARAISSDLLQRLIVADGLAETPEAAQAYADAQGLEWQRAYLYAKPAEDLIGVYEPTSGGLLEPAYGPIADGVVFPADVLDRAFSGEYSHKPVITGANRDEFKLFVPYLATLSAAEFTLLMNSLYGDAVPDILALYPRSAYDPSTPYNQFTDIHDMVLELLGPLQTAEVASAYEDVWLYYFTYDDLYPPYDYTYGAAHGFELPLVFGQFSGIYPASSRAAWERLSRRMMDYWTCFAHTGTPDGCEGLPAWPTYQTQGEPPRQRMVFDAASAVAQVPDLDLEKLAFWVAYFTQEGGAPDGERRAVLSLSPDLMPAPPRAAPQGAPRGLSGR